VDNKHEVIITKKEIDEISLIVANAFMNKYEGYYYTLDKKLMLEGVHHEI